MTETGQSPDVSVILMEKSTSAPILISDDSINKTEDKLVNDCGHKSDSKSSLAKLEETFIKHCTHSDARHCKKFVRMKIPEEVEELFFKGGKSSNHERSAGVDPARVYEVIGIGMLLKDLGPDYNIQSKTKAVLYSFKSESDNAIRTLKLSLNTSRSISYESIGRSSVVDSPSSSCASACAQYYQNKLLATLQILQNKEETVQVQTESLAVAEARIASLTARSVELKREIERKGRELKTLREKIQASRIEKSDVSITAQIQEMDNQKNIVTTLQNNLGVIEDLYRECFYETAKQEGLIEMLRKSYLDVRLMDKEKSDQISRLYNVINTQKCSLEKCQDIASDVDNLKVEISNFLNNSNNDSGVWEESLAGDLTEDLQDISGQLLRLRELLSGDCTCGLKEENTRLRQNNEAMANTMVDLRQKIADLENIVESKDTADRQHLDQIRAKESELHLIRKQLAEVECNTRERGQTCEAVKLQLHQTQVLLNEKTAELSRVQAQCQNLEETTRRLTEELDQAREIKKEYCALRGSTCAAQRRVRTLRAELSKALQHCEHMDACHRSKVRALEAALWEAQTRGEALCEEARRATSSVRTWTRHRKDLHREQELQMKQKESQIRMLKLRLEQEQNDTTLTRASENDTCTKCISARSDFSKSIRNRSKSFERDTGPSCSKCPQNEGSFTSVSSRVRQRREHTFETSASEMGSSSPPVPPQRPSRMKRFFSENRREAFSGSVEDVLTRVESAGAALTDSLRRWNRHGTLNRT